MDDGNVNLSSRTPDEAGGIQHPHFSETQLRMLGYVGRLGRLVKSASRYLAYTSDVGEAFRPIVNPWVVKAAYGVSWAYVGTDVAMTTYLQRENGVHGAELREVVVKRAVFQSLASMALPAFTIHQSVHFGSWFFKKFTQAPFLRRWGA